MREISFVALCGVIAFCLVSPSVAPAQSIRFVGNDDVNVDRIAIPLGNPQSGGAGPPADIGATDFTIEFWLRGAAGNDTPAPSSSRCNGPGFFWTEGNILVDRDRTSSDARDWGLAISGGLVVFGIEPTSGNNFTICSSRGVLDGAWHHVVVQRRLSGQLTLYIDGVLERQATGPAGDVSYPDSPQPGDEPGHLLVLGAEKHNIAPSTYPGFRGWIDELRLSNRVQYSANFTPPAVPFDCASGSGAVALYHFDENSGNSIIDACANSSPGTRLFGGSPSGPEWSTDSPFGATTGQIQFTSATFNVDESVAAPSITVTRTGGSSGAATVDVGATGGTAMSGADYQFTPATLSWSAGQSGSRTLALTLIDDADDESNETIVFGLSNATGASLASPSSATATIADDDVPPNPGTLQFSSSTYSVNESAATLAITVTRSGGTSGAATVDVAVTGGTATAGADYQMALATLSWPAGQGGSQTATLTVLADADDESNETVVVGLSNATGASLGSPSSATATIVDDDSAPSAGTLQFSTASYTVNEGGSSLIVSVARTGGSSGSASVAVGVSGGTATRDADYQVESTTLTWANGQSGARTFALTVLGDTLVEGDETVLLALAAPVGAALGAPRSATVTLVDDDNAPPPSAGTLQFSSALVSAGEAGGTVRIAVERRDGSAGAASVVVSAASTGTATAGSDFQFVPITLTWNSGQEGAQTLDIPIIDDALDEPDEVIDLVLSNASGATLGTQAAATVAIVDDDGAPDTGSVHFASSTYSVTEGTVSLSVSVTRSGGTAGAASVEIGVIADSATSGTDYQFTASTLNWSAGQGGSQTATLTVIDDGDDESDETVTLSLANASGAVLASPQSTTVTIVDDDTPPGVGAVQFALASQSASETVGSVTLRVTRSGDATNAASADVTVSGGTASSGSDYAFMPTTVTWAAGVAGERTVTVSVTNDSIIEGGETVLFVLSNPIGIDLGGTMSTTLTITDASSPPPPEGGGDGGGGAFTWGWLSLGWLAVLARSVRSRRQTRTSDRATRLIRAARHDLTRVVSIRPLSAA